MQVTVENLEKQLKEGKLNSIYLLYGEETFLLESCLKKIKSNFGSMVSGINYIKIDANNINSLISDIETPAFGYEKKLIIVRDSRNIQKRWKKENPGKYWNSKQNKYIYWGKYWNNKWNSNNSICRARNRQKRTI